MPTVQSSHRLFINDLGSRPTAQILWVCAVVAHVARSQLDSGWSFRIAQVWTVSLPVVVLNSPAARCPNPRPAADRRRTPHSEWRVTSSASCCRRSVGSSKPYPTRKRCRPSFVKFFLWLWRFPFLLDRRKKLEVPVLLVSAALQVE